MNEKIQLEIENYYNYKWWLHIIFDTETKNYLKNPHITFNTCVLENLKIIVESFTKKGYFSNEIKYNLYMLLGYAREYKDENIKERTDIINDIIKLLNTQEEDNSLVYYRSQLYTRTRDLRFLFCSSEIIALNQEYIKQLLYDDFTIIVTHQKETTEQQFDEEYFIQFQNQKIYYENLYMLLEECPYLFKDEVFYNRVMKVLNKNSKKEKFENANNKIKKKINRKIRRLD